MTRPAVILALALYAAALVFIVALVATSQPAGGS